MAHAALVAQGLLLLNCALASDVISDLVTPELDKDRALQIRAEKFWKAVGSVSADMRLTQHVQLYEAVEGVIAELDDSRAAVREALQESLQHLRNADAAVLAEGLQSSELVSEELASGPNSAGQGGLSWFAAGGQNFLAKAIAQFVEGGDYTERLTEQVKQRQQDLLPVLKSASSVTSNVLTDTRLASKRAFDVLKYDIYNRDVPKTPESAKKVANELVKAVAETRHRFTSFISGMAVSIANDVKSRATSASATVALEELATLPMADSAEPPALAADTAGTVARAHPVNVASVDARLPFLGL